MKKHFVILIAAALAASLSLAGCSSDEISFDRENAVKVVFNFEGGEYQNSSEPLVYYYAFKPGTENLIKDPAAENAADKFNSSDVKRADHYLDGWYRSKTVQDDGKIVYDGKWNFKTDKVDSDGVELYARWIKIIHYTYGVYYVNEEGEDVLLGTYPDNEQGDKFNDFIGFAKKRPGWTPVGYFQDRECTVPWDFEFGHPGGETNTEVKVYVKYTKGEFVEVRTAQELVNNRYKDIKLMNDIDMSTLTDDELQRFEGSFGGYGAILDGNGFKIKNLRMTYPVGREDLLDGYDIDESGNFILGISLFGISTGATVQNVKFENVSIDIDIGVSYIQRIIVAPFFLKAERVNMKDVSFDGTCTVTRLPSGFDESDFETVTDAAKNGCFKCDDASTFENVQINLVKN